MPQPHDEDLALVRRVQSNQRDLRPFEELVRRHEGQVLANCRSLSGSADDAQDLAQEVFVKVYFGLPRLREGSRFGAWVQRIKVNHCLNFLRRRRGRSFVDVESPVHQDEPQLQVEPAVEAATVAGDRRQMIAAALDRLPETVRVPLVMSDLDEMPYQDIADELGIGLSAVKMRIKRGREQFRSVFAQMQADD
jgi:RNA polymerase sigma-70 factor, ECF subfamily